MKKNFLEFNDIEKHEINYIFNLTKKLKKKPKQKLLSGKAFALLFSKPSTRTRVSFEVGISQLGGYPVSFGIKDIQLGRGESIADTARTLSKYTDGIIARLFAHRDIVELGRYASVPVINALTDEHHPCQALADVFTIYEKKKKLKGIKIALIGDGTENTFTSLIQACQILGIEAIVGCPQEYNPKIKVPMKPDPFAAVKGVDVVYTDTWVSMGQEKEVEKREKILREYQVNEELMALAKKDAIFMHPLPAYRGKEVTTEVIDGESSVVWDQAENRLHTQKALLVYLNRFK
ncbi:MAG: ornithine carbamoyltransferase [Candidatus Thermoplasmatota archaeon]